MNTPGSVPEIIGESPQIRAILTQVEKIGASPTATVLLCGESGTGKGLVARKIHACSPKISGAFIELNCAAIPETLLEAELFGYEQGAFTDARTKKQGLLELAHTGTVFLDEIDALSLNLQAKLLKVIDEKIFRRLGGVEEIQVVVRIIAATNIDLKEAIARQAFREDLYYRLNVISLEVPPLRERGSDVLLLARYLIERYNDEYGKHVKAITPEAASLMQAYPWPGNVRELKNVIERAMLLGSKDVLDAEDLMLDHRMADRSAPPWKRIAGRHTGARTPLAPAAAVHVDASGGIQVNIPEDGVSFEAVERRLLEESLHMARWNIRRAARLLHMSYDTFRYRMQKHGLR